MWGSIAVLLGAQFLWWLSPHAGHDSRLGQFVMGSHELLGRMWWGLALGILFVGLLGKVPRDFVVALLGRGGSVSGLFRATGAGLLLDLCSHGILLAGMKLYERGASLGQTMAFLIASPWNSFSLTVIMVSLIGLPWTLTFVFLSALVAILSGWAFERLVKRGQLPANPFATDLPAGFAFWREARAGLRQTRFNASFFGSVLSTGFRDSGMILRWIFFGTVLAALLRAAFPPEAFHAWFGPSLLGLGRTVIATTIIEICSEGSSPIAADLVTRAGAPGNAFAFLMAGIATNYTAILAIRQVCRSWKIALFLPLITVPQVFLLGWILNRVAVG